MKVVCVRPHGHSKPGDEAEVPGGALVCEVYWRPAAAPVVPPAAAVPPPGAVAPAAPEIKKDGA